MGGVSYSFFVIDTKVVVEEVPGRVVGFFKVVAAVDIKNIAWNDDHFIMMVMDMVGVAIMTDL